MQWRARETDAKHRASGLSLTLHVRKSPYFSKRIIQAEDAYGAGRRMVVKQLYIRERRSGQGVFSFVRFTYREAQQILAVVL